MAVSSIIEIKFSRTKQRTTITVLTEDQSPTCETTATKPPSKRQTNSNFPKSMPRTTSPLTTPTSAIETKAVFLKTKLIFRVHHRIDFSNARTFYQKEKATAAQSTVQNAPRLEDQSRVQWQANQDQPRHAHCLSQASLWFKAL